MFFLNPFSVQFYLQKYRANDPCNKGIWTLSSSKIDKFHNRPEQPFPTLDDGSHNAFQSHSMIPKIIIK